MVVIAPHAAAVEALDVTPKDMPLVAVGGRKRAARPVVGQMTR
jgi:hypothetical protein